MRITGSVSFKPVGPDVLDPQNSCALGVLEVKSKPFVATSRLLEIVAEPRRENHPRRVAAVMINFGYTLMTEQAGRMNLSNMFFRLSAPDSISRFAALLLSSLASQRQAATVQIRSDGSAGDGQSTLICRPLPGLPGQPSLSGARTFADTIPCGPGLDAIVEAVRAYWEAGFIDIALVQVGGDALQSFFDDEAAPLPAALRSASG